eukprot:scaffold142622_cov53-Attheya_sp.AAC.2
MNVARAKKEESLNPPRQPAMVDEEKSTTLTPPAEDPTLSTSQRLQPDRQSGTNGETDEKQRQKTTIKPSRGLMRSTDIDPHLRSNYGIDVKVSLSFGRKNSPFHKIASSG